MAISAQTFDEHKRLLWGLCYRMTGSAADADDIVQDTFVRALEKPPADMEAPLRPWLVKVAMNLSRDQLRRRRRRLSRQPLHKLDSKMRSAFLRQLECLRS